MTFRVWPPWVKLLPPLLALLALAAALLAAFGDDLLPGGDGDAGRSADWSSHPTSVPVLMYHHFDELGTGETGRFSVSAAQFTAHLDHLEAEGYTTITVSEYLAALDGAPLPERPVMLTVDDGFADQWGFVAILRERGMVATYFVPNAATLTPDQLRGLLEVGEVGGHTVSHPFLSDLSPEEQAAEIAGNRAWLDEVVGTPPTAFAYPFGDYDEATIPALEAAGYTAAFDAWGGPAPIGPTVDRWHIPRIEVGGDDTLATFAAKLAGADV
jgi:peptidoglycan/xylan/chitin deacetylase (PgdA/CDA1 family)